MIQYIENDYYTTSPQLTSLQSMKYRFAFFFLFPCNIRTGNNSNEAHGCCSGMLKKDVTKLTITIKIKCYIPKSDKSE